MDERTHARYMSDVAYFLSKMEAEPDSDYFIPIALAYNKLEKYDETIAMCRTAVERFPANCAAKTFLAEAYVYKGLFDQARDLLFDVTAEDDNNYKALKLLGIICKEKGDNNEAIKYLTGAFIRSPEDEEVRKMIEELGGTLNPGEIYDERMKRQSSNAADNEEDEELKTYKEIDKRIRNAEIIMADLVSDTSINARNYDEEEEDFFSDDPNDFMPLITKHEEEEFSDDPNDFMPTITQHEEEELDLTSQEETSENVENSSSEENDLLAVLGGDDTESSEENDLLAVLGGEDTESGEENDLLAVLGGDDTESGEENDLLAVLGGEDTESGEENDLLAVLGGDDTESGEENDLLAVLGGEDTESGEEKEIDSSENDISNDENIENSDRELLSEESENDTDTIDKIDDNSGNMELLPESDEEDTDNVDNSEHKSDDIEQKSIDSSENDELLNKVVPSSVTGMTYSEMIDDDFQYSNIVEESYNDNENPSVDLGEYAPFTQRDIMDEILNTVGMTQEDMADDERINLSEKSSKLIRLENFLEKVRQNKEK